MRENNLNAKKYNKYILKDGYYVGTTHNGYEFYFDIDDYDLIKDYCWHKHQDGYLRTKFSTSVINGKIKNKYILMHKLIMSNLYSELEIDHINGDPRDNRKYNLRFIEHKNNMKNCKIYTQNKTGHKGTYKYGNKYRATIGNKHLGTFNTLEEAIEARKIAEKLIFKDFNRSEEYINNGTR